MKFSNWFKIIWWVILLIILALILSTRINSIINGSSVPADILIFLIFIALMLVPIYSEIEFFGIKFKQELEDLKNHLDLKISDIKNDFRNQQSQSLTTNFNSFGPPPPDISLPQLTEEIERIVRTRLTELGTHQEGETNLQIEVPENNLQLFKIRFNIESELRRIWIQRFNKESNDNVRYHSLVKIMSELTKYEILDKSFYGILREILSICNYAVHGETVSENQASFVTSNAQEIIEYLANIN
ncbi:hypothetical protein [Leptospira idonii]|uniref:DUF4145 domain-containing protein n=1 Tax=Leptospira idonii TaxID=1193500 RepID=A0A4R9LX27_9LEPT|nr:hypothetical protein [Leptospira idonii]TGN18853.1 hypothetical protein EHS15_11810 [Leptospira idonii]